jgi:hypothetical protein
MHPNNVLFTHCEHVSRINREMTSPERAVPWTRSDSIRLTSSGSGEIDIKSARNRSKFHAEGMLALGSSAASEASSASRRSIVANSLRVKSLKELEDKIDLTTFKVPVLNEGIL